MTGVLTIAGSDSGGGAGIQADLKTITLLGGYGMSVITALTAQNSLGVQSTYPVPLTVIEAQLDSILSDMGVAAVKTGMLWDADVVKLVAQKLEEYGIDRVVVDPVMVAKDDTRLINGGGQRALETTLLPRTLVVTPNLPEASALAGMQVRNVEEMKQAAQKIKDLGPKAILVKGGHLEGDIVDVLFDGSEFFEFCAERAAVKEVHGTGCVLSAAIATELGKGATVREAVQTATSFIHSGIKAAVTPGKGRPSINFQAFGARETGRYTVITELNKAVSRLEREQGIGRLIPEVSSNLGYALPFAERREDVAAFAGRIVRVRDRIVTVGHAEFGASRHVASIILTAMRFDSSYRSAMNILFSPQIVQTCEEAGLQVRSFSRREEPQAVQKQEGQSLGWGMHSVLSQAQAMPDAVFDEGGWGKEPMVRILGRGPGEVVDKVILIHRRKYDRNSID